MTPAPQESSGFLQRLGVWLAVVILLLGAAATAGIFYSVYNSPAPHFKNPNGFDAVLDSQIVLAFIRIGILAAAVYIVVSVIARLSRGEFLSSVGSVRVGESVRTVANDSDELREQLVSAESTIADLRIRLERATQAVDVSNRDRDEVIAELSKLRRTIK